MPGYMARFVLTWSLVAVVIFLGLTAFNGLMQWLSHETVQSTAQALGVG